MVLLGRQLAAIAAALTLCVGNLAVCAGWHAAPEARMACCHDESLCPMHGSDSHGSSAKHSVTQTQADTCCAASERNHSTTTSTVFLPSGIVALAPATMPVVLYPHVPALQDWRALVPLPVSPVPKHLLLSVLLV